MTRSGEHNERRPRLSIGMPVYNAERYLARAIESLLAQTFDDFELIISDNASTDATQSICRRFAERDRRIRYVRQAGNRGANWNFNHVVGLARGELFKWAAADDLCRPTFLAQCIEVLDRDPGVVAVHAVTHEIGSNDEPIVRPDPANPRERYNCAGDPELAASASPHLRFRDVMLNHGWGVRCSGVFRLDALRKTGLFEPIYGWEKIMMAELALMGRFHLVRAPLFLQRVHDGSLSQIAKSAKTRRTLSRHYRTNRLPLLQYLRGYARAAWRAELPVTERTLCLLWIAMYVLQVRKWGGLASRWLGSIGIDGAWLRTFQMRRRTT